MESIRVLPVGGKKIRDPKTFRYLDLVIPLAVFKDVFWSRRIECEDVKQVKRKQAIKPQPKKSKEKVSA